MPKLTGSDNVAEKNVAGVPKMDTKNRLAVSENKPGKAKQTAQKGFIGGPNQPEMSTFKSVNANDLVNLFNGDFSYNIPLLDVGGYPVNIYYNGGIGPDQDASWVGLGWNINPGTINRNMRGVPDDFDGTDVITQWQNMKPNVTWGASIAGDLELSGYKKLPGNISASLGVSFNNYLGPALDYGVKGGVSFKVMEKVMPEKKTDTASIRIGVNIGGNLNSRSGMTMSIGTSLTEVAKSGDLKVTAGVGLGTGYNSRSGIKSLQISEQMTMSQYEAKTKDNHYLSEKKSLSHELTTISFAKPSYIPSIRLPLSNSALSGHVQIGVGIFGVHPNLEVELYNQTSKVVPSKIMQKKPLVGYLYSENAMDNPDAVMDFTRLNDKEVTRNTSIISAPQYTYDVFTIQGEGTGGSIRAYRNDLGYVRDNFTASQDNSTALGVDIGPAGHYGTNFNMIKTPSTIGDWINGNNLKAALKFNGPVSGAIQNVFFRNPGEGSVIATGQYDNIGGTDLVRFQLSGDGRSPVVQPVLERFSAEGNKTGSVNVSSLQGNQFARKKRTQVVSFKTADDASRNGLDKQIKTYSTSTILNADNSLNFHEINRVDPVLRKGHHISEIDVTESNGRRYVYGIPVYNKVQKDFTFTVSGPQLDAPGAVDKIEYQLNEMSPTNNSAINGGTGSKDGYVQVTKTPAYAHSFLLSGLLSPDYVDLTGDGITDDDLGNAVKFNYSRIESSNGDPQYHAWRTPAEYKMANFNPGNRSNIKDDKGLISYGEREAWYLHSIESKTMIAIFFLGDRIDGKGVLAGENDQMDGSGELGGIYKSDRTSKRLTDIKLYNKADLKKNGLNGKPIKTVHFTYSYKLCKNTPDNSQVYPDSIGKLTLEQVSFSYNGQETRSNKEKYVFSYVNSDGTGNPDYAFGASDKWGTYKPSSMNPAGLRNSDYPFSPQGQPGTPFNSMVALKADLNNNAGAWALKKILLPSGGQIEVNYECDDYAYVQDRRAADMMAIAGFGNAPTKISDGLYDVTSSGVVDNDYLFLKVPEKCETKSQVYNKYLYGMDQLAVKLAVNMPKGVEHLTSYASIEDYGIYDATTIWVRMKKINGQFSPLSITAIEFLREQLPAQAYPGYDVSGEGGLESIGTMLIGMLDGLKNAFNNPVSVLRNAGKARKVILTQSFARLNDPDGFKYGGGHRVRSVKLKDNWEKMAGQYLRTYEQTYDYTTTEVVGRQVRIISSGVASYEPSIGGEENPFHEIKMIQDKLPLGPSSYGAIELPVLDAFFPYPSVGYSKVTVRSLSSSQQTKEQKTRSGIGRQVTEFYTTKDYPVKCNYTSLDPAADFQKHEASLSPFLYKYAFDGRALSQGFSVELNDMDGKMKSQSSFSDNDTTTRISYSINYYRNTGANGLNEQFDFVSSADGGTISKGNTGVDIELMSDTREFSVKSNGFEAQFQVDLYPIIFPIWIPMLWPTVSKGENVYRAVTTTKVINYHAVLDSTVAFDKGSQIGTRNLVFDAETGNVIVSRTTNEFDNPVYTTNYPAWWAYSGMGPAYKNADVHYDGIRFYNGMPQGVDLSLLESGDELFINNSSAPTSTDDCDFLIPVGGASIQGIPDVWTVFDRNKNKGSLADSRDLIVLDHEGKPATRKNVSFKVIRSGRRNLLDAQLSTITSLNSPIVTTGGISKLQIGSSTQVVSASAIEYREKWQVDNGILDKAVVQAIYASPDGGFCFDTTYKETVVCDGPWILHVNPYAKGLLGNYRPYRTMVYYGSRTQSDFDAKTNISTDGVLSDFKLYWDFDGSNKLMPDAQNPKWVWNSKLTKVNSKGQELETVNALGIYTSAQYGFNKSLPVAIAQNARNNEMFSEGFEDYLYKNRLDGKTVIDCASPKLDLFNLNGGAQVIPTEGLNFAAHTGKYVLQVNGGMTASVSQPIPVNGGVLDTFNLMLKNVGRNYGKIIGGLNSLTYGTAYDFSSGNSCNSTRTVQISGANPDQIGIQGGYYIMDGPPCGSNDIGITLRFYLKASSSGNYRCGTFITSNAGSYWVYIRPVSTLDDLYIGDAWPGQPRTDYVYEWGEISNAASNQPFNLSMCSEKYYEVLLLYKPSSFLTLADPANMENLVVGFLKAPGLSIYQSLDQPPHNCYFTLPMPASDSMSNANFSVTSGKKMVVSAWVHETCGDEVNGHPCKLDKFSNNEIHINDGSTDNVMKPSGPIIEGWQRYEGYFTPAHASTQVSLSFKNTGSSPIYFDDIRIHPFNANMKSYVYDPITLRLVAELDENNYASFYEYDEEGTLIRSKAETREGIKTIKESRSAKQRNLNDVQ